MEYLFYYKFRNCKYAEELIYNSEVETISGDFNDFVKLNKNDIEFAKIIKREIKDTVLEDAILSI